MTNLVGLALLISLDNLRLGLGVGLLGIEARERRRLSIAVGMVEALMPVVGFTAIGLIPKPPGEWVNCVAPVAMIVIGGLATIGAGQMAKGLVRRVIFLLPFVFGLDNLLAGMSFQAGTSIYSVLVVGCLSGLIGAASTWSGSGFALRFKSLNYQVAGLAIVLIACSFLVT